MLDVREGTLMEKKRTATSGCWRVMPKLQFRLRTLLLLLTALGIALPIWTRDRSFRRSRAAIEKFGAISSGEMPQPTVFISYVPEKLQYLFWPNYTETMPYLIEHQPPTNFTDADLADLSAFKHLQKLCIPGSPVTSAGIKSLSHMNELVELNLNGSRIDDEALRTIGSLGALESLSLEDTAVTNDGMRSLSRLKNLKTLALNGTGITDGAAESIAQMANLTTLDVSNTRFSAVGAKQVWQQLQNVKIYPLNHHRPPTARPGRRVR